MKPWMWAALAAVVIVVLIGVALLLWPPAPSLTVAPDSDVPLPASIPDEPPPAEPVRDPAPMPDVFSDTDGLVPDEGPDLTPEHVQREEFDAVMDKVIETCGLGQWSEMERACTDWRCLSLVASPVEAGVEDIPKVDTIVGCPAWTESWGTHPDFWIFGADCPDGTTISISLLGPSTLRMRRGIDQGFIEEFQVDIDAARERACALWGR